LTRLISNVGLVNAREGCGLVGDERSGTLLYSFKNFLLDTARRELRRSVALVAL